jgi:xanthine/CO dehydrogenase XdhC/CoxF family maturation factor
MPVVYTTGQITGTVGWIAVKKKLLELEIRDDLIERLHSLIGLELDAETPKEIALSIMVETVMLRNHET